MTKTTAALVQAWAKRYTEATDTLHHAEIAPALFKPEHVAQTRRDAVQAERQFNFW